MLRQPLKMTDASVNLSYFSIVTYTVDPESLARLLPPRFTPVVIDDNGSERGLVSAVTFKERNFSFQWMKPFQWIPFWQTNYRAYVEDVLDGQRKVWFFQTMLGSVTAFIPKHVWRMPWYRARYSERVSESEWQITGRSSRDIVQVNLSLAKEPATLKGFGSDEVALEVLTNPSNGYYFNRDGRLSFYSIWHERIENRSALHKLLNFTLFTRLGLVDETEMNSPHSIIIAESVPFEIYLPPKLA